MRLLVDCLDEINIRAGPLAEPSDVVDLDVGEYSHDRLRCAQGCCCTARGAELQARASSYTGIEQRRQGAAIRGPNLLSMNRFTVPSRMAPMKTRHLAAIWALTAVCTCACSQDRAGSTVPADPGARELPPVTDPEIVKRPPANVDPKAVERPPGNVDPEIAKSPPMERTARPSSATPEKSSREDDCRGPADLCKQDSAR